MLSAPIGVLVVIFVFVVMFVFAKVSFALFSFGLSCVQETVKKRQANMILLN